MNGYSIDWSAAWIKARKHTSLIENQEYWNKRAPSFAKHVTETDYEKQFLQRLSLDPSWDLLDVGCAAGTLAVPLAGRVASVTALDFSPVMIDLLRQRCAESGITNIKPVVGSWEDDWESLGIGTYDVVIASRSLAVGNLSDAIAKLNRTAREMVCISTLVGDGPFERRIFDAVGRPLDMGPDYIYIYNYLYQVGICADISFIVNQEWKCYENHADAVEKMRWMLTDMTEEEERRLMAYLAAELVPFETGWRLPAPKVVRWAFITWKKVEAP
jgi:SAM-dependent methyltransferase